MFDITTCFGDFYVRVPDIPLPPDRYYLPNSLKSKYLMTLCHNQPLYTMIAILYDILYLVIELYVPLKNSLAERSWILI